MLEQVPDLDAVIVAVGGGGLVAGIAARDQGDATRRCESIGVQTDALPRMQRALAARRSR